ncbi:Autophagy-related protein 11 [Bienertia sinuspersici]
MLSKGFEISSSAFCCSELKGSLSGDKMSSNVTGENTCSGRLLIHIAENGHSYKLDCDDSTIVESVQRFIESMAGIQFGDQLLLCGDLKLESNEVLGTYKLPSDDQEVFCFNKARLQAHAMPPPPEQIETQDIPEPSPPSSNHDHHPLDNAVDPALKALPSYERQFRYHYHRGHAIFARTTAKYRVCERILEEQKVQERAIEIARRNLDYFFRILNQNYMDFLKCYSQQHRAHSDLLVNFTRDIEKLKSCKLIPALQTSTRKCLLDLVKEENLRKWFDNCSCSHKQFENKVSQFKHVFGKLKQDVEDLFSSKALLPIRDLDVMIKEHCRHINEQRSIMQSLSKDVSTVKKLVDDCLSSQLSSSLRPHDAVSALGPMYDVHDKNHLPKMTSCDSSISDLLDYCSNKKNEMNNFVHNYMQKIAYIQHTIKDVRLQFNAFSEAIKRQDAVFDGLKVVRGIGPAYRACLAEVVRRKASMKLYMGMAGQLAEKLATRREDEVRRREEFLKAQSSYIPRDVIAAMGLFDTPSQCDVNIVPFDTSLLDIDIRDIDYYAPESLVGPPSKCEKPGRTSLSMSNNSSHSSESEGNAAVTTDKYESQDAFDVCDLVDVAGTSKLEVENAKLRADFASLIARFCFSSDVEYESLDDSKVDGLLKNASEKTTQALQQKDEYIKHLESMLKAKQQQCQSYEKRIDELAQQLTNQYMQTPKCLGTDDDAACSSKTDDCRSGISDNGGRQLACRSTELMDEISCTSNPTDAKDGLLPRMTGKAQEVDENMADSSGMQNPTLDSSMLDPQRDEQVLEDKDEDKILGQLGAMPTYDAATGSSLDVLPSEARDDPNVNAAKVNTDLVLELQSALEDKANQLTETEKNCLHEARQEAQTHLCAADRRAAEYSTLRASAVKMRGLFERLRTCVNASGGVAGFADALHDGTVEFRACIRVLADRVGILSRQRSELLDRYSKAEAANKQLSKELEERKELVKTLYTKHQFEKQVHEIAAFILNSSGHYEAITRNCPNYFLSPESVALFTDHLPTRPAYIIGQIVHIERRVVKPCSVGDQADSLSSSSSADTLASHLPVGCEYFIVTVAMLPDTTIHSPLNS